MEAMRYVSEVSAYRRGLNSHETAKPQYSGCQCARGPTHNEAIRLQPSSGTVCAAEDWNYLVPQCHVKPAHCEGGAFIQWACQATVAKAFPGLGRLLRLEGAAYRGRQRRAAGAGRMPREIARPWQVHRRCISVAALPNPSLKRSANGGPPGPVCGEVHSPQPGPGVPPSSPA